MTIMLGVTHPTGDVSPFHKSNKDLWLSAETYCNENRKGWEKIWEGFNVPPDIAEAVVFPEIVRYSRIQDKAETAAVYGLYVANGSSALNFSIGRFQMKPSFAEKLEKRWMKTKYAKKYETYFDTSDNKFARKARINRLTDNFWQCVYLSIFLKLLYLDYGSNDANGRKIQDGIECQPLRQQIVIAATAYNRGCEWSKPGCGKISEIRKHSKTKHFHTAIIPTNTTRRYVYCDIALEHWKSIKKNKH